jgi:hypothetical protein
VTSSSSFAAENERLDEELKLTFPASDPPSITQPVARRATRLRPHRSGAGLCPHRGGAAAVAIAAGMIAGAILAWRSLRA